MQYIIKDKYKTLVLLNCLLAVLVVGLGAYTRLSDAGLGCPDWPGCYGFLTVPKHAADISTAQQSYPGMIVESAKAWKEMIHRYFAGTLGLLIFALFIFSLIRAKQISTHWKLPLFLVLLVAFQAILGMLTVTMQLQPLIVMGHLLGGFSILSLLCLMFIRTKNMTENKLNIAQVLPKYYLTWCFAALSVLIIQIALGGWLAANYAAPHCTGLPLCDGNWQQNFSLLEVFQLPAGNTNYEYGVLSSEARMSIHLVHRIWAVITAIVLLTVAIKIWLSSQVNKVKNSALVVIIAVTCQVLLGVILVHWHFPISIALAHNMMAAFLLVSLIRLTYHIKIRS